MSNSNDEGVRRLYQLGEIFKPSLTDFDLGVFRRLYYSAASIQEYKKGSVPSKYRTLLGY
ncbi:MAG: hypothetical protein FWG24_06380 [Eggerthellaceae bacterium]|nr:hypothetical protein [Eggerthellaceae bacterium]